MGKITEHRAALQAAVEPLLRDGEEVSVAAGPSEYQGGLSTLGFSVVVLAEADRLDDLLEPEAGIRDALSALATVTKSSGHRSFPTSDGPRTGVEWTATILD